MKQFEEVNEQNSSLQSTISLSLTHNNKSFLAKILLWFERNKLFVFALVVVLIAMYLVFFTLPNTVVEPVKAKNEEVKVYLAQQNKKPLKESPWREVQLGKQRKESQEILAKVLEKQKVLEDKQVNLWAKKNFKQALTFAQQGDLSYRSQEFDAAKKLYRQALTALTTLESTIEQQLNWHLAQAKQALAKDDAQQAKKMAQIALYLASEPLDVNGLEKQADNKKLQQAQRLFDRSLVLDQVIALVKEGNINLDEQRLENAKTSYQQGLALDRHSLLAKQQLQLVNRKIIDRDYSKAMVHGFAELAKQQFTEARQSFVKASKLKPSSVDPKQAIEQLESEQQQFLINNSLSKARQYQQNEEWAKAVQAYVQALKYDSSLIAARIGALKTKARAELDRQMQAIIDKPNRLTSNNVYQQAQQHYLNAIKIKQPGKKLLTQITQVKTILTQVHQPIVVVIKSDNLTKIMIKRIGDLGHFNNKNISLSPGEYTVIGTRNGYRDVIKQLSLKINAPQQTIKIQCVEKLVNG